MTGAARAVAHNSDVIGRWRRVTAYGVLALPYTPPFCSNVEFSKFETACATSYADLPIFLKTISVASSKLPCIT